MRERQREREKDRERSVCEREREFVCVCLTFLLGILAGQFLFWICMLLFVLIFNLILFFKFVM